MQMFGGRRTHGRLEELSVALMERDEVDLGDKSCALSQGCDLGLVHGSVKLNDLSKVTQPERVELPLDTTVWLKNHYDILLPKEKAGMLLTY